MRARSSEHPPVVAAFAPVAGTTTRARRHAALGEPVRLRIVDQLVLGDASPGELGLAVGLPTNLLAHHLGVLQDAGLVRRVRSEGDGRRAYVQLRWDDAQVAALATAAWSAGLPAVPRVVFVCTANSARSQLAAARWRSLSAVPAASAGTRPAEQVHPRAQAVAARHGLDLAGAVTCALQGALRPGDLVVAVCDTAHEELSDAPPDGAGAAAPVGVGGRRWLHWAVADPVRHATDEAFEAALADLDQRIARLAATATATHAPWA